MKHLQRHILVFALLLIVACAKENVQNNASSPSLLKVMQLKEPFYARNVLELIDGSIIIGVVAPINGNFDEFNNPSSLSPSVLTKYRADGTLIWQLELPEVVHVLWQTMELKNGTIAVVGFNSDDNSNQIGIVTISLSGKVLNQSSFFNVTNQFPLRQMNPVACAVLSSGNIAIATSTSNVSNAYIASRLIIFDSELTQVVDRTYQADGIVQDRPAGQISIVEDVAGNIILHGLDRRFTESLVVDSTNIYAFAFKLSSDTYDPIYYQSFKDPTAFSPSSCALSNSGKLIWASCSPSAADSLNNSWFNQRNQELYLIGSEITVWQSDANMVLNKKYKFSGFPKSGYIKKLIKTSDGGYMLLGTCNINSNQQISSEYQVMLIKLSTNFTLQWMQFPKTNSQSVASDIIETEAGYLVSATHLSFGEQSSPILFKTDKNGNIK